MTTGQQRIWRATRDAQGAYVNAAQVAETQSPGSRQPFVTVSGDDKRLVFSTSGTVSAGLTLWTVSRANAAETWQGAKEVDISSSAEEQAPFLDSDGALWFSVGNNVAAAEIHFAARDGDGTWKPPDALPAEVNGTGAHDTSPVLSRDGLSLYFGSSRETGANSGVFRIYVATRVSRDAEFFQVTTVPGLVGLDARPSWISADGCRLYFFTERKPGGSLDIMVAERPR